MAKKYIRRSQKGYALITAMAVGVVALSITGAVMLRMSSSTAQITRRERTDETQSLSESVLNSVLDAIAEITADGGSGANAGIYKSATGLAYQMHNNDFLNTGINTATSTETKAIIFSPLTGSGNYPSSNALHVYDTGDGRAYDTLTANPKSSNSHTFWQSLDSDVDHSTTFWRAFSDNSNQTYITALAGLGGTGQTATELLDNLHKDAYSVYHVKKGSLEADVEISVVPLANDVAGVADSTLHAEGTFKSHNDVLRVRVMAFWPSIKKPTRSHKVEAIINRPVKRRDATDYAFRHAVLAGGSVNLQNFNTSSGPCAAGDAGAHCIDSATTGDVHTNGNLSIGSNGHVQGKVTATGNVNVNGTVLPGTAYQNGTTNDPRDTANVTGRVTDSRNSQSDVDEIPIPNINTDTSGVDLVPCTDLAPADNDLVIYENCKLDGNLDVNNNKMVEYRGTVHVTGNLDIRGSQRCTGTVPCKVVIDGTANVGGNGDSSWNSTQEALYVVNGKNSDGTSVAAGTTCLDVGGNPDAAGQYGSLFYVNNANCHTTVRGNSDFFGGIITKGSVGAVGNASNYGIQRDSDMSALAVHVVPDPVPKNQLFPAVISWKDLR